MVRKHEDPPIKASVEKKTKEKAVPVKTTVVRGDAEPTVKK